MKPLIVIPARGGSKGIPRKNIKLLGGKPLIQYTIEAARELFDDSIICVSTDDLKIRNVVESTGLRVPFVRPAELATDSASTQDVLIHAIQQAETNGYFPDTVILLQATSPFRKSLHIRESLVLFDKETEMVVSVKATKSNPYYVLREEDEYGWLVKTKNENFTRRQDCPTIYEINGAIYIINVDTLKQKPIGNFTKVRKYLMDELSSIDIDTPLEWELAEIVINRLL